MGNELPPNSVESEYSVLGSIIWKSNDALLQVCDFLKADDFYHADNRRVYEAMLAILSRGEPIDTVSVGAELERKGPAFDVYLGKYIEFTNDPYNIRHHAGEVAKSAACRRGIQVAASAVGLFHSEPESVEGAIGQVVRNFLGIVDKRQRNSPDVKDILVELQGRDRSRVTLTSMHQLDRMAGGFEPTHLWVIGGFSSTGKTAFALQLVLDLLNRNKRIAYFSLEMSRLQLMLRLLGNKSGLPIYKVDRGGLDEYESDTLAATEDWFYSHQGRFWIYDDCYNLPEIEYLCRKHKLQSGLDVAVIDFIQNLQGGSDEYERLSHAAKSIQALAKQLDCCIVVLSQISNEQAKNDMGAGDAYSFKGSGAIRDAADKAWILTRDRDADKDREIGTLRALLKKNRQGPIGEVRLKFHFATGRIYEDANS